MNMNMNKKTLLALTIAGACCLGVPAELSAELPPWSEYSFEGMMRWVAWPPRPESEPYADKPNEISWSTHSFLFKKFPLEEIEPDPSRPYNQMKEGFGLLPDDRPEGLKTFKFHRAYRRERASVLYINPLDRSKTPRIYRLPREDRIGVQYYFDIDYIEGAHALNRFIFDRTFFHLGFSTDPVELYRTPGSMLELRNLDAFRTGIYIEKDRYWSEGGVDADKLRGYSPRPFFERPEKWSAEAEAERFLSAELGEFHAHSPFGELRDWQYYEHVCMARIRRVAEDLFVVSVLCLVDTGGAHKNYWKTNVVVGADGKAIMLSDVFRPGFEKPLSSLLAAYDPREIREPGFHSDPGNEGRRPYPKERFLLTKTHIVFEYDPYDIGSWVDGVIQIRIPYEKVLPLMRDEFRARLFPREIPDPKRCGSSSVSSSASLHASRDESKNNTRNLH